MSKCKGDPGCVFPAGEHGYCTTHLRDNESFDLVHGKHIIHRGGPTSSLSEDNVMTKSREGRVFEAMADWGAIIGRLITTEFGVETIVDTKGIDEQKFCNNLRAYCNTKEMSKLFRWSLRLAGKCKVGVTKVGTKVDDPTTARVRSVHPIESAARTSVRTNVGGPSMYLSEFIPDDPPEVGKLIYSVMSGEEIGSDRFNATMRDIADRIRIHREEKSKVVRLMSEWIIRHKINMDSTGYQEQLRDLYLVFHKALVDHRTTGLATIDRS